MVPMRVWFDCTAAAHPLVLRPIIERSEARGQEVLSPPASTARRSASSSARHPLHLVGEHGGASRVRQGAGARLTFGPAGSAGLGLRPDLAIAHGSVDLALSLALFIPSAQLQDYEYAGSSASPFRVAKRVLVPESIPVDGWQGRGKGDKLVRYPGLKEDYYLAGFEPDPAVLTGSGSTARGCWSSCGRRPRRPSITPTTRFMKG